MSWAQPNRESTFGGAMYEVSGGAQVTGEIRIGTYGFERGRRSAIAVFADQSIDGQVFAKFLYARREDDQLGTVGQRHAGSVDCLVSEPGAVKLIGIKINDSLSERRLHRLEVHFQAQRGGAVKALSVVADEKAAHRQPFIRRASDNGEDVHDGQMSQETIRRVIKNVAHGVLSAAHDAFHPVNRAQIMAAVYALSASRAHQNILVVIGHDDNFMRHDLADRQNEIKPSMSDEPVHLCRPRIIQLAFGLLVNKPGWDLAEGLDVGTPVMHAKKLCRHG